MKILLIGKRGSIVNWLEYTAAAFHAAGHDTRVFAVEGEGLSRLRLRLARTLRPGSVVGLQQDALSRCLDTFRPQMVVAVSAFWWPAELYALIRERLPGVPVVGWVGDRFTETARRIAPLIDRVYFTDSGFADDAKRLGLPDNHAWLPHAVDTGLFRPVDGERIQRMLFVANPTPVRTGVLRHVHGPVVLYGKGWNRAEGMQRHEVHARRISVQEVARLYPRYVAVLNIVNEYNVGAGLNQRHFEPPACATPVISDDVADISRCFEPGREILVYRDADELNELYERILADPAWAGSLGQAARRRVLSEHTYQHRVEVMLRMS